MVLLADIYGVQPVVVRGGAYLLKDLIKLLSKAKLSKRWGTAMARVGPIPYFDKFSIEGRELPLRRYIDDLEQDARRADGPAAAVDGVDPTYLFSREFMQHNQDLASKLAASISSAVANIDGVLMGGNTGETVKGLQFCE